MLWRLTTSLDKLNLLCIWRDELAPINGMDRATSLEGNDLEGHCDQYITICHTRASKAHLSLRSMTKS